MPFDPEKHHRKSIRLKGYDYSSEGAYFITICAQNREHFFGGIQNGEMVLNDLGKIVNMCWQEIPDHYPHIILDEFVVMPNHMHGILVIGGDENDHQECDIVGAQNFVPNNQRVQNIEPLQNQKNKFQHIIPGSICSVIRGYKIGVTKWARQNSDIFTVWQRNYHEHIIRNEKSYENISEYIRTNPQNWEGDCFFGL